MSDEPGGFKPRPTREPLHYLPGVPSVFKGEPSQEELTQAGGVILMPSETPKGHSPGPWRWDPAAHSSNVLRDAKGEELLVYNRGSLPAAPWYKESTHGQSDRALIASAPELLKVLRELEWAGGDAVAMCPECGNTPDSVRNVPGPPVPGMPGMVFYTGETERIPGGHTPDCDLAALLDRLGR